MPEARLSVGPIYYEDTGGELPVVVLFGGLAMNGTLWETVVSRLREEFRCVVPTLPLGGHPQPMARDADLSLSGHARILAELLEHLELHDLTLVECDTALAQLLAADGCERIARLVLCSCETVDNYPPGLPGRMLNLTAKLPGGVNLVAQQMRLRALRRAPFAYGRMAKRPIPDHVTDAWLAPLQTRRGVRRDLTKYIRSTRAGRRALREASARLGAFNRPVLVVWAAEDRVMPLDSGRGLAQRFPDARLVEIPDSYTLLPLDQPERLAAEISAFAHHRGRVADSPSQG